jgi:hypothetical protein
MDGQCCQRVGSEMKQIQIIGIKFIPRDIVFDKGNLKFLTLKGIEDIPLINTPPQLDYFENVK